MITKSLHLNCKFFHTGDIQLSKQEIADADILICTPEKYDVATRKGGDGSLGTFVSLIIIDEVHLLADERGAVIETVVARTHRYIETNQKLVRIVGLSATLPNYKDVADFLRVNEQSGLFYFGAEFRPIPLTQTLIGITEKQHQKKQSLMIRLTYEKIIPALERGKQVMVFVHSRKETSSTIQALLELFAKNGTYDLLNNTSHPNYSSWKKRVEKARSIEVQNFFAKGVGVHHAGMLRMDRTITEQLFECGMLKILCCTATLAWGVNLPAHMVIIKGTEMYDPERGGFVDISILDVLQIFGRSGRPGYDSSGHAVLISSQKSLSKYIGLLTNQAPIESSLIKSLADHLNAEIVNGTINNIKEAVSWLSYTFLFVRMRKNPLSYGMKHEEIFSDPRLENKRKDLIRESAEVLDACMMIRYDRHSGNLAATDLGRIASHYYLKHSTIESFNRMLSPHLSLTESLHLLTSAAEFDQLKVRPEELSELDELKKACLVKFKIHAEDTAGKVAILLQCYLNQAKVQSFTLQSDTNYIAQNSGRICRALFEICLKRGWSSLSLHYLNYAKSIDKLVQNDHSPLRQFQELPMDVLVKLEQLKLDHQTLKDMEAKELGKLVRNQKYGHRIRELLSKLPSVAVDTVVQPISSTIIRLVLELRCDFEWSERYHGKFETFWLWVEDGENEYIYHSEYMLFSKENCYEPKIIEVMIPVKDPLPSQYFVRITSDIWVGCETLHPISFQSLLLPKFSSSVHTNLLHFQPLPKSALKSPLFESLYKFSHFNPIQSQVFQTLYHDDCNCLIGAPTGSGKTIIAELAILRILKTQPQAKIVYVAPLKALAKERLFDWKKNIGKKLGLKILELTGENTPELVELQEADILIVTPEKWDGISRGWQRREYVKRIGLMIIDEIHLLGVDRGPVLVRDFLSSSSFSLCPIIELSLQEVIVSRMRFIAAQTRQNIRFVGLSTALANARDLGDWLGIHEGNLKGAKGLYNFRPSVRPVPMTIHIQGFPGKHYCPRMATMNKPAYCGKLLSSTSILFI
jgi:activating signal cointegrator complex subunit 3